MQIVEKPWGYEEIWTKTAHYVGKVIVINPNCKLSRQFHNQKEETFRVIAGSMSLELGHPDVTILCHEGWRCVSLSPEDNSPHVCWSRWLSRA